MITAEKAYKKIMQSLINFSDIESKINNAIENKKFNIIINFQEDNIDKIYRVLYYYFTALGYGVSKYGYIGIKISWDL